MENKVANFGLVNIVLLEATFKREKEIPFEKQSEFQPDLSIDIVTNYTNTDQIEVELNIKLGLKYEDKTFITVNVSNVGIFNYNKESPQDLIDKFVTINAPAIIFPFTREVVANLSIKAALNPIYLQPVNFVELSKKIKVQES